MSSLRVVDSLLDETGRFGTVFGLRHAISDVSNRSDLDFFDLDSRSDVYIDVFEKFSSKMALSSPVDLHKRPLLMSLLA